jgi:hypothetical protein
VFIIFLRFQSLPSLNQINDLPTEEMCLIKSLLGRASYGGMAGDMKMLKYFVHIWYKRFQEKSPEALPDALKPFLSTQTEKKSLWLTCLNGLYASVHQSFTYKDVGHIVPDDCLLSGIDFHCSPIVSFMIDFG